MTSSSSSAASCPSRSATWMLSRSGVGSLIATKSLNEKARPRRCKACRMAALRVFERCFIAHVCTIARVYGAVECLRHADNDGRDEKPRAHVMAPGSGVATVSCSSTNGNIGNKMGCVSASDRFTIASKRWRCLTHLSHLARLGCSAGQQRAKAQSPAAPARAAAQVDQPAQAGQAGQASPARRVDAARRAGGPATASGPKVSGQLLGPMKCHRRCTRAPMQGQPFQI
jgi:hypothetical protein